MVTVSHLRSLPLSSSLLRLCFLSLDLLLLLRFELLCRSLDLDLLLAMISIRRCAPRLQSVESTHVYPRLCLHALQTLLCVA